MKKLKQNQLGPWCSFCPPKTERAVYRQDGFGAKFSCEQHKDKLKANEMQDDNFTEADYQTWINL